LDAGIFIVHHGTKGSQSEKRVVDVGAGASAQSRSADAHIALREHEVAGCVVFESRVRSFAPSDPMVIHWEHPVWRRDILLNPEDLKTGKRSRNADKAEPVPAEPQIKWTPAMFVETFIADQPVDRKQISAKAEIAEVGARKAEMLINAALADGLAFKWHFPKDRTVYLANRVQGVTDTVKGAA
jgi:hypothetical protein